MALSDDEPASPPAPPDWPEQLRRVQRRLDRERAARLEAEAIAEQGLRELYASQRTLELLQRVATASNQSGSIDEALRFAIHDICHYTGWSFGNSWRKVTQGEHLVPTGIWWARDRVALEPFITHSQQLTFDPGKGLPWRQWQARAI